MVQAHGASDVAVDSPPLQGLYDLVFAFQNGEADKPNFAAGTAFLCIFRICLTYKGAIFWKMQAGMGDTIFTPLYDVLKKRGVTFKFFHRVQNLGLSADKTSIETISIAQQATLKDRSNDATYQPFVTVQDLECWPANPNYDQLTEGEALRAEGVNLESFYTTWKDVGEITLKAGQDFDRVIFGIALGSIPFVCSELLAANKEWKLMAENVETVRTMAYQAWLKRDLKGLGWENQSPVLDAYVDPLNTWADMSQLIVREDFDDVKNIAYFCGPMVGGIPPQPDQSLPAISKDFVEAEGKKWMNDASKNLWPLAFNEAGEFDLSIVKGHFARANIDPTERYVLSVKGSAVFRIRTDKTGFSNLLIAGDWTENPINAGCVEAAVMSGMMAANVLSGKDIYDGIQETGE